jgi:SET domain-containing protein
MLHLLQTIRRRSQDPDPGNRQESAHGLCVMKSPLDGYGCFATVRFPKNSAIAEYAGERITHSEAMRRMRGHDGNGISELDADCYIDANVKGNNTRYINHSCEPNAEAIIIDGFMIISALQDIMPGEEITVDYLNSFADDRSVCRCRTSSCRQRTVKKRCLECLGRTQKQQVPLRRFPER